MVKYKYLNVKKAGMQKRVGWGMETVGWKVGGLALYDGLLTFDQGSWKTDRKCWDNVLRSPFGVVEDESPWLTVGI